MCASFVNDFLNFTNLAWDLRLKSKWNKLEAQPCCANNYWLVDGDKFIGEIGIRHELNNDLLKYGCNDDNCASVKVIENNHGKLENTVENIIDGQTIQTRRYWIDLS